MSFLKSTDFIAYDLQFDTLDKICEDGFEWINLCILLYVFGG